MSLRRAVGFLLRWRFSPQATPRTVPASSLHFKSLRDLPIGDVLDGAAIFTAAALAGAGATLAVQYFTKGPAAGKMIGARKEVTGNKFITRNVQKLDMKERFEQWIMQHNKTYRDEEEKAMRFQLFKATVEWIESHPPDVHKRMFPKINSLADLTEQEYQGLLACPDEASRIRRNNEMKKLIQDKYEKGESPVWMRDDNQGDKQHNKQGYKQETQASA